MSGWLKLQVSKGRSLVGLDASGYSDPYVRVSLDGASAPMTTVEGGKVRTAKRLQTLNPSWNESFVVRVSKKVGQLRFEVWDESRLGDDLFMGHCVIDVGIGTQRGSAGEAWLQLLPRDKNRKDEGIFKRSPKGFGEIHVRWFWTYSTLGQLLCPDDVNKEEDVPLADFEMIKLTTEITRFSNLCYTCCLPWFWLDEKFRWSNPFESLFVLWITTFVCMHDMLLELFLFTMTALMTKWLVYRCMYGYYGKPVSDVPRKAYPDPFAWMREYDNLTMQLQMTQNSCAMVSDLCDYVVEILTWERQDTASLLTQLLMGWTVLAYFGWAVPFRYVLLAAVWYMFTYYPMMMMYPKLYKVLEPGALIARATSSAAPATPAEGGAEEAVVEEAAEPAAAEAAAAGAPAARIHPCITKALEMKALKKGWETVSEVNGVRYEKAKVSWCPVVVVRISGTMEATSTRFAKFLTVAEKAFLYDDLLDKINEITDLPDKTRVLHTAFKSPVMFVTPRDFCSQLTSTLLHPDDYEKYNISCASHVTPPEDLMSYDTNEGVFVSGGRAIKHPKCADKPGFVRGTVFGYGWIAEPTSPTTLQVTYIVAMSPNGMIPAKAAEKANIAQVEKFKKVKEIFAKKQDLE